MFFAKHFKDRSERAVILRGARHRENLTQAQLAELTGIPQRHISEMETEKRSIGKQRAKLIAKVLNAVTAGVTGGIKDVGKDAIGDAYNGLKNWIVKKVGKDAKVTSAIAEVEQSPDSKARQMVLAEEMLTEYADYERIYLSWDSASWHGSKRFLKEIDRANAIDFRSANGSPEVCLAPLPACAQFLNIIESVFSGLARAIIHNSNYDSVEECKKYIDRYFQERNSHFKAHPKRAGDKIWGHEREIPVFSESNNCKDPRF